MRVNCIIESLKMRLALNDKEYDFLLADLAESAFILVSDRLFGNYESISDLPPKYRELIKSAITVAYNQQGAEGMSTVATDITQVFNQDDMYDYINKKMPHRPRV